MTTVVYKDTDSDEVFHRVEDPDFIPREGDSIVYGEERRWVTGITFYPEEDRPLEVNCHIPNLL